MPSVQDYRDCPRCGKKGVYILECRSGEDWFQCLHCGVKEETVAIFEKSQDSEMPPDLRLNNGYTLQQKITEGFGSYCVTSKDGRGQFGIIADKPIDDATILEFKKVLENPDVDPSKSYLTKWDEESKEVICLVGTIKPLL